MTKQLHPYIRECEQLCKEVARSHNRQTNSRRPIRKFRLTRQFWKAFDKHQRTTLMKSINEI